MKLLNLKMLLTLSILLFGRFLNSHSAFAQEGKMDKTRMEAPNDNMSWDDYKKELRVKYQHVVNQIDHMQKEYAARNLNNTDFKKSLAKFEINVKKFGERMKNSDNVPADKQARFRKKMKSELKKLSGEYEKIRNRWENISAANPKVGMSSDNKMPNDNNMKMNWEEFQQDIKGKYKNVTAQVDRIQQEAKNKQISAPEFKDALDRFEMRSKEFASRIKDADAIPNDKQEEFKRNMKEELNKLNTAFDDLKARWEKISK